MTKTMTMKKGTYYVGDLIYAMGERELSRVWEEMQTLVVNSDGSENEGIHTLKDGRVFAQFCTAGGDGVFEDNVGNCYGVDNGNIGCILFQNIVGLVDDAEGLVQVITFDEDFEVSSKRGVIRFGHIKINTK